MGKRENQKIIVDGFKAEPPLSDDAMLAQLYDSGVPFSDLRTVFNDIVKEKELRLTSKERKIKTEELMKDVKVGTVDEMLSAVALLETKLKVATTKALGSLRTWAKAHNIELPKAPRASKARKVGFGGHYEKILANISEQRAAFKGEGTFSPNKKDVVAFCHKAGIPEAYSTTAMNVVHFAQIWAGEIEETVEAESEAA